MDFSRMILFTTLIKSENNKISCFSTDLKTLHYIYAGVALNTRISEVQPVFRAASRSPADRAPKFSKLGFRRTFGELFRHLGRLKQKPSPPRGRSRRPLHRHVLRLPNPPSFDRFPNPSSTFPVRSTMAGTFFLSPAEEVSPAVGRPSPQPGPSALRPAPPCAAAHRARVRLLAAEQVATAAPCSCVQGRRTAWPANRRRRPQPSRLAADQPRPRSLPLCWLSSVPSASVTAAGSHGRQALYVQTKGTR